METSPIYNAGFPFPLSLDAFKRRDCARRFDDEAYRPPTATEVRALIKLAGWSQTDVAKLVGVTYDPAKGSQTVRRWQTDEANQQHRAIPYAAWRLLLMYAGVVNYPV